MLKRSNIIVVILTLLYFAGIFVVTQQATTTLIAKEQADAQNTVQQGAMLARSSLEASLYRNVYLADSLATVVNLKPQFATENWQSIAEKLAVKSNVVRSIGMAPDNIIQYTYPLKGNEVALGVDFRDYPEQLKTIEQARLTQDVVIAGPLNLVQGGLGLIARYPIFSDFPLSMDYWGTVSVILDFEKILQQSGLPDIKDARIALRGTDGLGQSGSVFYGDESVFANADELITISIPKGEWIIAVQYDIELSSATQTMVYATWAISFLLSLVLYIAVVLFFRSYRLAHLHSLQDELTKLPNRRFVLSFIKNLMTGTADARFSLVNIDLNRFKAVNDTLGHEAGDALLVHVAWAMRHAVRANDVVARMGGDEFLLVLPRMSNAEQVAELVQQLKQSVEKQPLYWQDQAIYPSLSCGYVVVKDNKQSLQQILAEADTAMYKDKENNRGYSKEEE